MVKETGFYALLSRMRYISRWGLMRSSIPENVQEHSHETAVYAHALGVIRREIFGKECDAERLAVLAVYHDASEILTGDLPTPIKYHDRTLRDAYKKVERAADERLLAMRSCAGHTRAHSQHRRTRKSSSRQPTSSRRCASASKSARRATANFSPPRSRRAAPLRRCISRRQTGLWSTASARLKRIWTNWGQCDHDRRKEKPYQRADAHFA